MIEIGKKKNFKRKRMHKFVGGSVVGSSRKRKGKGSRIRSTRVRICEGMTLNFGCSIYECALSRDEGKKGTENEDNAVGTEKSQRAEMNGDTSSPSRKSKRRHRQAELKLPLQRLIAYGKIPSKSKSKNH